MNRLCKLIACLKEFGIKPHLGEFQDRLVIQKSVCLLELLGVKLDYDFSLYVRGPYSPDLTQDLYSHKSEVQNLKTDCELSASEKKEIAKVKETSNDLDPVLLEIMATYSFMKRAMSMDNKNALVNLKKLKPYPEAQIALGVNRAKQLFFAPSKKEFKEMKAEFKAWEEASDSDFRN